MNTGCIRKSSTNIDHVQIPNIVARSKQLTLIEKGLLAHLISLPSDWVVYKWKLYEYFPDKPGTIDKAWKGLHDKGFIVSVKVINEVGRFVGWEHIVYNLPDSFLNNRSEDLPKSEFTEVGKSQPIQIKKPIQINNSLQKNSEVFEILEFEDDQSNQAWKDWLAYRKQMRKPVRGITKDKQLRLLRSLDGPMRVATINQSITQGWMGLFEVKSYSKQEKNEYSADLLTAISKLGK